ncbi:MAG: hypothetical protein ACK5XA_07760 [Tagaea sp.]
MRERDIERYLVERVKELGGEVRKVKWIGRRGAPDRVVMLPCRHDAPINGEWQARTIWVELKAPGKVPDPHQNREHRRMRAVGQRVEVVDSLARVEAILS